MANLFGVMGAVMLMKINKRAESIVLTVGFYEFVSKEWKVHYSIRELNSLCCAGYTEHFESLPISVGTQCV